MTAVIPTFNRAALVCRAVESALAQELPPDEVIVVDDGSSDGTAEALARFGERVRCLRQANAGVAAARNAGVRAASSDWIALLDDDDVWLPGHLARMRKAIAATDGVAALYFSDARLGDTDTLWSQADFTAHGEHELRTDAEAWILAPRQPLMTPAVVVSRAAYLGCHGQDERLLCREDTHLFLKLGLTRPVCAVAGAGARVTPDAAGARLTSAHPATGRRYLDASVRLTEDVLERVHPLTPAARRELRRRLAVAHWRRARLAWREHRLGPCAAELARSLRREPRVAAGRFASWSPRVSARSLARHLAYRSGWLGALHRLRHRRALTVVTFHRVLAAGDPRWATADPRYTVDAGLFADCLVFFKRHYSPVSLEQIERGTLPARPLLVTLDDGWADSADTAAPLLRDAGVPALLFVASDTLRRTDAFWPERLIAAQRLGKLDAAALARAGATPDLEGVRALISRLTELPAAEREPLVDALAPPGAGEQHPWASAEQLRGLRACGVTIGAHSARHEPLVRATDLEHELREPPAALAAATGGRPPDTLSFPHGAYDERVLERARAAGYRILFTSEGSLNGLPAGDLVHRVGVYADALRGSGGRLAPDRLARALFPCAVTRATPRRPLPARVAAAIAALLAIAGAAGCGGGAPAPAPAPPTAGRFVSPAGSDAGRCRAANPCRSFDRAYQLARPGERVTVAAGAYPLQRIAPASRPRGGRPVAFVPAPGARVRVRELVVDGSRVSFARMRTGSWTAGPTARRVTFRDLHVAGGIFVTGARGVRVIGGSVGPGTDYSSEIKAPEPGGEPPRDVVIDGVRFHDWVRADPEAHVDCLHVLAADGLVIRRSSFRNCEAFAVLLTGYGAAASPTDVLVEDNHIVCCRSGYAGVSLGSGHGEAWRDVTVRDNRSTESFLVGEGTTAPGARVRFERNTGPAPNPALCSLPGVRWSHNRWTGPAPCAGDRIDG